LVPNFERRRFSRVWQTADALHISVTECGRCPNMAPVINSKSLDLLLGLQGSWLEETNLESHSSASMSISDEHFFESLESISIYFLLMSLCKKWTCVLCSRLSIVVTIINVLNQMIRRFFSCEEATAGHHKLQPVQHS
jgi:hypothetical protein